MEYEDFSRIKRAKSADEPVSTSRLLKALLITSLSFFFLFTIGKHLSTIVSDYHDNEYSSFVQLIYKGLGLWVLHIWASYKFCKVVNYFLFIKDDELDNKKYL
ncbi:Hypothetical protein PP7435_CHR3-1732 [Komagataella phaffii CBS 7435]|uniref:Uncharacterized protein n=1 Tax=Komagataella phaffii (strain ATCC 76273 / CBS 7435 / CECT 11047 / NRRL Y-11430 / Wegner 21-1) TaxID=981350 RepID=A0A1G4KQB5_KOMPC|nr:GQ67_03919T0 [Komagataella phaffii]AOA69342.1 GQ68_03893T0 [Komagataella phaffii GS115]CAH2449330.1 Hypothetical protein BQ9382_C3-2042 [Komagataella phaffii CBS 7435]SCV12190.1 Hypothetical protein PP7435_CHR3-1732 [Komagataella phaffii CBS 7435]